MKPRMREARRMRTAIPEPIARVLKVDTAAREVQAIVTNAEKKDVLIRGDEGSHLSMSAPQAIFLKLSICGWKSQNRHLCR